MGWCEEEEDLGENEGDTYQRGRCSSQRINKTQSTRSKPTSQHRESDHIALPLLPPLPFRYSQPLHSTSTYSTTITVDHKHYISSFTRLSDDGSANGRDVVKQSGGVGSVCGGEGDGDAGVGLGCEESCDFGVVGGQVPGAGDENECWFLGGHFSVECGN